MSKFGFQTEEFINRLVSYEKSLPDLIIRMSSILRKMIQEVDSPSPENIENLHAALAEEVVSREKLMEICGEEGKLCQQCPFGAYLPRDVLFASSSNPFCLPWIAVTSRQS